MKAGMIKTLGLALLLNVSFGAQTKIDMLEIAVWTQCALTPVRLVTELAGWKMPDTVKYISIPANFVATLVILDNLLDKVSGTHRNKANPLRGIFAAREVAKQEEEHKSL